MKIPEKYLHQSGRHKGNLKQDLLQCEGEFVNRDPHPFVKGVFYKGYCFTKNKQNWGTIDHFPELKTPEPPKGIPDHLIKNGRLNNQLLQVEGDFKQGQPHPDYPFIVFHGIRDKGKQRWQTKEAYELRKKKGSEYMVQWRKENLEEARKRVRENHKKLWANEEWAEKERQRRKERRANRTPEEIERDNRKRKAYEKKYPERIKASRKKDYWKHRDRYLRRSKEWAQANPEKVRERSRRYDIKKRKDPEFRILQALRSRLYTAVKSQGAKKSASTLELAGCTTQFLCDHLESQFQDGMTWDNYGTVWHVDHVIPCKFFDMTKPIHQKVCFNWQNLQPLWADENHSKSDKIPWYVLLTILMNNYKTITL